MNKETLEEALSLQNQLSALNKTLLTMVSDITCRLAFIHYSEAEKRWVCDEDITNQLSELLVQHTCMIYDELQEGIYEREKNYDNYEKVYRNKGSLGKANDSRSSRSERL